MLSLFWSITSGLLVPVIVVLVGVIAVVLDERGLTDQSVVLGSHLKVTVPAALVEQPPLRQLVELVVRRERSP